jgi:hypothetical protein
MKLLLASAAAMFTVVLASNAALAQTWSIDSPAAGSAQGPGRVNGVLPLPDGGLIVSGVRGAGTGTEGFVAHWDAFGQPLFEQRVVNGDPGRTLRTADGGLLVPWNGLSAVGRLDGLGTSQWLLPTFDGFFALSALSMVIPGVPGQALAIGKYVGCSGSCLGGIVSNGVAARFSEAGSWLGMSRVQHPGSQDPGQLGNMVALGGAGIGDGRFAMCGRSPYVGFKDRGWVVGVNGSGGQSFLLGPPVSPLFLSSSCTAICTVAGDSFAVVGYSGDQGWVSWVTAAGVILREVRIGSGSGPIPIAVAAADDGGVLVAARELAQPGTHVVLLRLDGTGVILWQRRFAALTSLTALERLADVAPSANGGWFVGTRGEVAGGQTVPRVYRLDAAGNLGGSCGQQLANPIYTTAPGAWLVNSPAFMFSGGASFTSGVSSLTQGTTLPLVTCSDPAPAVQPVGGQLGGTLSFGVSFPAHPGDIALVLLSAQAASVPFSLSGGVFLMLLPDSLTLAALALPELAPLILDAQGQGLTGALPLPFNPGLQGLAVVSSAACFEVATGSFSATTQPATIVLQ